MDQHRNSGESVVRHEKVGELRASGVEPYAERFEITHDLPDAAGLPDGTKQISVAGRVVALRVLGKLIFGHISSAAGRLQFAVQKNVLPDDFARFRKFVNVGDYVGLRGEMFTTRTREKTLNVATWTILSKALRPLPEKFHGMVDKEQILRRRYLDLVMSTDTVSRFQTRSRIIRFLREYLHVNGFLEIDTPVLINKASGALATPFKTHHNALDLDVYLRIAPETYLKRAVAGGFDRVFEIARCFRNEGMDPSHLPDFTMLEYYVAYWNYVDNMAFTETLVKDLVLEIHGDLSLTYQGQRISFEGDWPRVSFRELIRNDAGIDIREHTTKETLKAAISEQNISLDLEIEMDNIGYGTLIDLLYKKVSRPKIVDPVFLVEHPVDVSPLARSNTANPSIADRFQLVVNGWEVVNAYSELIDPEEQRERLNRQMEARRTGDQQAMEMDDDFILCMEHGMPPMSGWGMGVDRVVRAADRLGDASRCCTISTHATRSIAAASLA